MSTSKLSDDHRSGHPPTSSSDNRRHFDLDKLKDSLNGHLDDAIDQYLDVMTVPEYFAAVLKDYANGLWPFMLVEANRYKKFAALRGALDPWAMANARLFCDAYRQVYHLFIARAIAEDIGHSVTADERCGLAQTVSTECEQLFRELEYILSLVRGALSDHLSKAIPGLPAMRNSYSNVPAAGTQMTSWKITDTRLGTNVGGERQRLDGLTRKLCDEPTTEHAAAVLDLLVFLQDDKTKDHLITPSIARVISSLAGVTEVQTLLAELQPYQKQWSEPGVKHKEMQRNMARMAATLGRLNSSIYQWSSAWYLTLNDGGHLQLGVAPSGKKKKMNQHKKLETLVGNLPVFLKHIDTALRGPAPIATPSGPYISGVQGMDLEAIFKDLVTHTHCPAEEASPAPSGTAPTQGNSAEATTSKDSGSIVGSLSTLELGLPSSSATSANSALCIKTQPGPAMSSLGAKPMAHSNETFSDRAQGINITPDQPYRHVLPVKSKKVKTRGVAQPPGEHAALLAALIEPELELIYLPHEDYLTFQFMMNFSPVTLPGTIEFDDIKRAMQSAGFEGELQHNGTWIFRKPGIDAIVAHPPHPGSKWSRGEGQDFGRRLGRRGVVREVLWERE